MGRSSWVTRLSFRWKKLPLGQLTPFQMGSSRTPICRMKASLRLTLLTLSHLVLGYGTRAHLFGRNLMSTHSLSHQSSGLGFATYRASRKHMGGFLFPTSNPLN
ncbi:hypothetical protein H5410_003295 [Solanum commersonii]|uniref:Uncharacterized protein n=1 Tax=Solanum commersonii TaxID=4109 RepID=A0A9J6B4P9_SOLCO|nr:hypothetical protein H5410_003295 [Solanum commersonii]